MSPVDQFLGIQELLVVPEGTRRDTVIAQPWSETVWGGDWERSARGPSACEKVTSAELLAKVCKRRKLPLEAGHVGISVFAVLRKIRYRNQHPGHIDLAVGLVTYLRGKCSLRHAARS